MTMGARPMNVRPNGSHGQRYAYIFSTQQFSLVTDNPHVPQPGGGVPSHRYGVRSNTTPLLCDLADIDRSQLRLPAAVLNGLLAMCCTRPIYAKIRSSALRGSMTRSTESRQLHLMCLSPNFFVKPWPMRYRLRYATSLIV